MVKLYFSLLLASSLLIGGSYSASHLNNVTVPSDILSELFFNEIRNNEDLLAISGYDTKAYSSTKCILSLREMINQFPAVKVIPFFDSWGKFPSGILYGNLYDVGNFDQCVKTSVTLNRLTGEVNGQYCFASVPIVKEQTLEMPSLRDAPMREARSGLLDYIKVTIGICIPDSCSPDLITRVFELSVANAFNGALKGVSISYCTDAKKPEYKAINVIGITFFSLIALLMILSSVYDFFTVYLEKTPVPILLAFSILTNGKKLFAINTKRSANMIDCLTGIRVFSMIWVMYGHTFGFAPIIPMVNTIDVYYWLKEAWTMHLINATVSVDSFFFIGGLLVAWLGFRELDRTNGKLNVIMMYVHRYIRLTPSIAAALLFLFSVNALIGTGPFRKMTVEVDTCDGYNWWPVLLYIQNYYVQDAVCYGLTWYLAIDFQLYILSPLLLIPMWKWGKKFSPVLFILALLSIGCVIATYFTEGYTDLKGMFNQNEWEKTYTPTHTRYSPWLVGFGLGYFMHINRNRTFRLSKLLQLCGWIISFGTIVAIIFAPYFTIKDGDGTVFEAAMYESLKRVSWAIALAWITFACHFGYGGVVDTFLSHPYWQPLGRLTYSLYLVHIAVLAINLGVSRTSIYFSNYQMILYFWGIFGMSLIMAITMTLAFESPIFVLEKAIFGGSKSEKKTLIEPTTAPQVVIQEAQLEPATTAHIYNEKTQLEPASTSQNGVGRTLTHPPTAPEVSVERTQLEPATAPQSGAHIEPTAPQDVIDVDK